MSSDLPAHPASRNWWRFRAGLDKAGLTDRLTDPRPGRPELQPAQAVACTGCGALLYEQGASIRFELPGRGRVVLLCAGCSETFGDLVEERGLSRASPLPLVTEASCTGTLTSLGDEQFLVCGGECPVHICTATTCGCQFGKMRRPQPRPYEPCLCPASEPCACEPQCSERCASRTRDAACDCGAEEKYERQWWKAHT